MHVSVAGLCQSLADAASRAHCAYDLYVLSESAIFADRVVFVASLVPKRIAFA